MRKFGLLLVLGFFLGACQSTIPSLRTSIAAQFGKQIKVDRIKTLCKLPPGTPVTNTYVFLGCSADGIPVVLDLVCQRHKTITKACSYRLDIFKAAPKTAVN
jgi:hypothetical protein